MHLLRSEYPTVRRALTNSETFLRVRGFSVAADHVHLTLDVLDLEILVSGMELPISGNDYAVIYAALGRIGGAENEELAHALARRMLS